MPSPSRWKSPEARRTGERCWMRRRPERLAAILFMLAAMVTGCSHFGHYPVNAPLATYEPGYGYIAQNMGPEGNSEEVMLILSFTLPPSTSANWSFVHSV